MVKVRAGRERSALLKERERVAAVHELEPPYDKSHVVTTVGFILNQMATTTLTF